MKPNRKERVYRLLSQFTHDEYTIHKKMLRGIEAKDIAKYLKISRANASKELNDLVREKKAIKIKGKPVLFLAAKELEKDFSISIKHFIMNDFNELFKKEDFEVDEKSDNTFNIIGAHGSLKNAITVAKSAIIYPPKGLNTLITGETGVGKSLFAEEMYKFGKVKHIFQENAPFIVFNCADYIANKQLLLSQLFGYIKGAFTGATSEKSGLVEQAENGILFLDEIHRLPEEGQEMLFLLMDKGIYRKLGETSFKRKAHIMIIGATTENPSKVMLSTFLRRIPIMIHLPSLEERSLKERLELVLNMFNQESFRLKKKINVSKEVIRALLQYQCKSNIGQLKSDIQMICAKAFLESMTHEQKDVLVNVSHLSTEVYEGLIHTENKDEVFELLSFIIKNLKFPLKKTNLGFNISSSYFLDSEDIYDEIKNVWEQMTNAGIPIKEKNEKVAQVLEAYTKNPLANDRKTIYNQLIDPQIIKIVKNVLIKHLNWAEKDDFEKYISIIALHIQHVISSLKTEKFKDMDQENSQHLDTEKDEAFLVANEILTEIHNYYNVSFNYLDIIYMTNFLNLTKDKRDNKFVGILVIMHGTSTASSMANFTNSLLNTQHVKAIDMDLESQVTDILQEATQLVAEIDEGKGVLILADMGSILSFEKYIYQHNGILVKTIDLISTPLLLEAARKSLNSKTDLKHLYQYIENLKKEYLNEDSESSPPENSYFDNLLITNIEQSLTFLNPKKAYQLLKPILLNLLVKFNLPCTDDIYVKFMFHACSMIERSITKETLSYNNYDLRLKKYPELTKTIKSEFNIINEEFGIQIYDEEFASLIDIFEIYASEQAVK